MAMAPEVLESARLGRIEKPVLINLPPEIVEKARKHGLNISKVEENALIDIINRIEGKKPANSPVSSANASSQEGLNGASGGIRTRDQQLTRLPLRPS